MKKGGVGYAPAQGRTFTPSASAKWTDEFSEMMAETGLSRNKLTEKLIEDGLRVNRSKGMQIPLITQDLSKEQIELLSSDVGQQMLVNIALSMIGGTGLVNLGNRTSSTPKPLEKSTSTEHAAAIEDPIEENVSVVSEVTSNQEIQKENENQQVIDDAKELVSDKQETPTVKSSAAMNALAKYKNMRKSLNN